MTEQELQAELTELRPVLNFTWNYSREKVIERFWRRVAKTEDCWEWQGARMNGYGAFTVGGRIVRAHVFSHYLIHGFHSARLIICHHCDNPVCVNPDHLYAGTHKDNARDKFARGRGRVGEKWLSCKRGHPLTGENICLYYNKRTGRTDRACRTCRNERQKRAYWEKKRAS